MYVCDENGRTLMQMRVPTDPDRLRQAVEAICAPRCVIFEEGPLSALVCRALEGVADRIVSCDPTHNALIALDEASNDERDARHLAELFRLEATRQVYIPREPYLSLRSLLSHRLSTVQLGTRVKNRIKALARRWGMHAGGTVLYEARSRALALDRIESDVARWQIQSLWRTLDSLEAEIQGAHKKILHALRRFEVASRLCTVPGVGEITSATLIAWIADPWRFQSRNAIISYFGLGLGQNVTSWQQIGPARASLRGNRQLKRVLLLAAGAAAKSHSALGRYWAGRMRQGWEQRRMLRDMARKILRISWSIMKKGDTYDDSKVRGPIIAR